MRKPTKRQRVEKYLNQLMKGRYFKIDDLLTLTAGKLQENTPLMDISKSTIASVLSSYKSKFSEKKAESPDAEAHTKQKHPESDPVALLPSEIAAIRRIIVWFDKRLEADLNDFEDLKSALSDIGLDYRKLLQQYRQRY